MNLIKLGKKGQVSIPQGVLRQLGIAPDAPLLVETTADGAIVLRQVSVHPVEIYSDERLAEFERENALTPSQARRFAPQLGDFDGWLKSRAATAASALRVGEPAAAYRVAQSGVAPSRTAPSRATSKAAVRRPAKP